MRASHSKRVSHSSENPDAFYNKTILFTLAVFAVLCAATWFGHGLVAWGVFAVLVAVLYAIAPARRYPTAEKVAIVTGPTSGIGVETARVLAMRGAHVVMMARNFKKLEQTKQEITDSLSKADALLKPQLTCIQCDLEDLDSVRSAAQSFLALGLPLHLLVCNAGIMALPEREESKQGFEKQVGVCHVAHFLLFKLLQPCLQKAGKSRVVALSSSAWRRHDGVAYLTSNPPLDTCPYCPWTAYGNAKVSNLLFAKEIHNRFHSQGISGFSVDPGGIHTGLQVNVPWNIAMAWRILTPFFFKSIAQGAGTTITCCTNDVDADGGMMFNHCKATDVGYVLQKDISEELKEDAQAKLWKITEEQLVKRGYL